jgi:hypothetical protein
MNFRVDRGASQDEMEAVVSRAFDALESGETREVALLFTDAHEGGGAFENAPLPDEDEDVNIGNDNNRNVETTPVVDENIAPVVECVGCGEEPCVIFYHQDLLIAFDEAENAGLAVGDIPSNNVRRKKLYRQLTLVLNDGPLGAGVRRPFLDCCVAAIRYMLPSKTYMGFKAE